MERIEQDRWARLLDAARHVNGGSSPAEPRAARIAIGRPARRPARRFTGRRSPWLVARAFGALAILAVGAVHLQQYEILYSAIPTIGTLFLLNFVGATAIGVGLLAPLETLTGRRWGAIAVDILALAGIGLAATSFAFLAVSEQTPLFGFMEPGYDPAAILASRIAEGVAVLSLGAFEVARFVARPSAGRW
jgi:hypothetical protein